MRIVFLLQLKLLLSTEVFSVAETSRKILQFDTFCSKSFRYSLRFLPNWFLFFSKNCPCRWWDVNNLFRAFQTSWTKILPSDNFRLSENYIFKWKSIFNSGIGLFFLKITMQYLDIVLFRAKKVFHPKTIRKGSTWNTSFCNSYSPIRPRQRRSGTLQHILTCELRLRFPKDIWNHDRRCDGHVEKYTSCKSRVCSNVK